MSRLSFIHRSRGFTTERYFALTEMLFGSVDSIAK